MMEEWMKAWAAAILDSRGHIVKRNNRQRAADSQQITVIVDTSVTEIAARLCTLTGSKPEAKPHKELRREWLRRGCSEHCPESHVHMRDVNMPDTVRWSVTGVAAAIVLWNLLNYMTTSDEPWEWALGQCLKQARTEGRGVGATRPAVQRLQALGWDIPPPLEKLAARELEAAG